MFPFLAIFIIFLVILTYYIKKGTSDQAKVQEEFWEKERLSNITRKKDISKLDYITIPLKELPQKLNTDVEKQFFALAEKPMINLTGISNTDLKLMYGAPNLSALSEYDANFTDLVAILPEYTSELLDAGLSENAQTLLEFAVSQKADSKRIFIQLASIYKEQLQFEKIKQLYDLAEELPELTKMAIQNELSTYLP